MTDKQLKDTHSSTALLRCVSLSCWADELSQTKQLMCSKEALVSILFYTHERQRRGEEDEGELQGGTECRQSKQSEKQAVH